MIEIVIIGLAVMALHVPKLWLSFLPSIIVKNGTNYPKYDEKNYLHNCQTAIIEVYCVACQNLPIKQTGERIEPDTATYAHRLSFGLLHIINVLFPLHVELAEITKRRFHVISNAVNLSTYFIVNLTHISCVLCIPSRKSGIQCYPDVIEIIHQVEVFADRTIDLVKRHVPLIDDGDPRW